MNTLPFLQQVAQYYASNDEMCKSLADIAFVLPNRRSAQQLERYLGKELKGNALMPRLMSMNDLVDHIMRDSNPIIASPTETLFIAYAAYCQSMGEQAGPFDKFTHWGQIIVHDFNDVDMNLVDAKKLYTNLNDLRDIATDYLEDEELQESLRNIFGLDFTPTSKENEHLFKNSDPDSVQGKYLTLWSQLAYIYEKYGQLLEEKGFTTQGKLYRNAVDKLKDTEPEELGFSRIVMVGHDMLSESEISIFKSLQKKQIADFWWDNASPALDNDINPAKAVIDELAKTFKSPVAIDKIDGFPSVTVNYVPSVVGMAKCAFEGIDEVSPETAIVLPDEVVLEPLLNSIPDALIDKYTQGTSGTSKKDKKESAINITMGYSLRRSNIATLIHLVTIAHRHATFNNTTKEWMFYREDVRNILSHPIIKMSYTETVLGINNSIEEQREFNIPAARFNGTPLEPLFTTLHTSMNSTDEVKAFINRLEAFCMDLDSRVSETEHVDEDNHNGTLSLQCAFIQLYVGALNQLRIAIDNVGLPVNDDTIFHLIDRATASALVPFDGKSGVGIQVMGLLETRCMDFNDLRILSANEGSLPPKANTQSLIPNRFRAAFNMPTVEKNDAEQMYRLYRLISRASKVTLYCDSSNVNEPSRFIEQLHKVFGANVERVIRTANITTTKELEIIINDDKLKADIKKKYTEGDVNDPVNPAPCLSASSIKEFLKCPLKFYFHHLRGLSDDNQASDFMDASQFGTIVHDTLQEFYYPTPGADGNRKTKFNKEDIEQFKKNGLDKLLTRNINRTFNYKTADHLDDPLSGQAFILFETMRTFVVRALDYDKKQIGDGELEVIECEETHKLKLRLTDDVTINFTFKADRIDRIGNQLRIIDYKTGEDKTSFSKVEDFFNPDAQKPPEAIMQLFIYAMAYMQTNGDKLKDMGIEKIAPIIYKLSDIDTSGAYYPKPTGEMNKKGKPKTENKQVEIEVDRFYDDELIVEFGQKLAFFISKLWTDSITQAPTEKKACTYCNFTDFCRR